MRVGGSICFYRIGSNELILARKYYSVSERKKIIQKVEAMYGQGFKKMYIQISPDVNEEHDEFGINKRSVYDLWVRRRSSGRLVIF